MSKRSDVFTLAVLMAVCSSTVVRAQTQRLKVTRVAVSTSGDTVQVYFDQTVNAGSCKYNHKVAARLDTPAGQGLLSLALAAQLSGRQVEVDVANGAADCVAESPRITFLRMFD
jgi:hypothetical protein